MFETTSFGTPKGHVLPSVTLLRGTSIFGAYAAGEGCPREMIQLELGNQVERSRSRQSPESPAHEKGISWREKIAGADCTEPWSLKIYLNLPSLGKCTENRLVNFGVGGGFRGGVGVRTRWLNSFHPIPDFGVIAACYCLGWQMGTPHLRPWRGSRL